MTYCTRGIFVCREETLTFSLWALIPRTMLGKGNQCKLANRRKVTLCWWLWEVISKNVAAVHGAVEKKKHKKGSQDTTLVLCAHVARARVRV